MRKFRSALFFKCVILFGGAISSTRASSNESAQEEAKYEIETRWWKGGFQFCVRCRVASVCNRTVVQIENPVSVI